MPLFVSEDTARLYAADMIRRKQGDISGVQQELRRHGAHSEQARRLVEEARALYVEVAEQMGWPEAAEQHEVQAQVEHGDKVLNVALKADRLPITTFEELVDFYGIDTELWEPTTKLFNFWGSEANPNFQVRAAFQKREYAETLHRDREEFRQFAKNISPEWAGVAETPRQSSGLMFELVLSDLHAESDASHVPSLMDNVRMALEDVMRDAWKLAGDEVRHVELVVLGDTFNSDNAAGKTTKGTQQVNHPDWQRAFSKVREMLADTVASVLGWFPESHVSVRILPGNHDRERSYYLTDSLWAYFHSHPNVSVDISDNPRRYVRWGSTTLGFTHGDSIKPVDLAMCMLREASPNTLGRMVWHMGHIHTRREEEVHGVEFKWFRTANDASEWGEFKGYGNNRRDVVGILWDQDSGERATFRSPIGDFRYD